MSLGLDLSGVQEQGGALDDGSYNVCVEKAELKPTKSGGELISVQFKVLDGPSKGRSCFTTFNTKNSNPLAVQIGLGQLKGFMRAFGHKNVNKLESTQELVGLKGTIKTKQKTDDYGVKAEVKGYAPLASTSSPAPGAPQSSGKSNDANPFG